MPHNRIMFLLLAVVATLTGSVLTATLGAGDGSSCSIPTGAQYNVAKYSPVYSAQAKLFPASALDGNLYFSPGTPVPDSIDIRIYCKKDRYGDAIHKSQDSVCRAGTWVPRLPTCTKKCGRIPIRIGYRRSARPSEYSRPGKTYEEGHTVTYRCMGGKHLVGNKNIECRDGQWSNPQFRCIRRKPAPKGCKLLTKEDAVLQGPARSQGTVPSGTVLTYQCSTGRVLQGNGTVVCTDGKWSNEQFKCEMPPKETENQKCGIIPWASQAYSSIRREQNKLYEHGYTITYTCWLGYRMTGNGTVICENGKWTNIKFICTPAPKGCKLLTKEDAVLQGPAPSQGTVPSGTVLTYQCSTGRVLQGNGTVVCTDGKWSNEQFKCEMQPKANLKCGTIPWPDKAFSSLRRDRNKFYDHGLTITYSCWSGYRMEGKSTIVCENGQWTAIQFRCVQIEKECGTRIVRNASPVDSRTGDYPSGFSLTYRCTPGTFLTGNSTIVCTDGQWSDVKFSCGRRPVYAPPPKESCPSPNVKRAVIDKSHSTSQVTNTFPSGGAVSFRCLPGMSMKGNSTIVCNDGTWSDVNFSCRKSKGSRNCYRLSISGAKPVKISKKYEHDSVVEYKCKSGLQMVGTDSMAKCNNGRWYIKSFMCAPRELNVLG